MKHILILLTALCFSLLPAQAGLPDGLLDDAPFKPFEITLSYGSHPYHLTRFGASIVQPGRLVHNSARYKTDATVSMNTTAEFAWYFSPRWAVTQLFGYHKMKTSVYDSARMTPMSEKYVYEETPYYLYTAGIRYVYVIRKHYRLYGELQAGYVWKNKDLKYFQFFEGEAKRGLTGQIIPMGIQTTGRLFLNVELISFGEYANTSSYDATLGVRAGLGFRF